jgi:integrase
MTAYGEGLRISQACALKTSDLDSKRMLIHVHEGKRSKDRYVMLSERLLDVLRTYWKIWYHARRRRHPSCSRARCGSAPRG